VSSPTADRLGALGLPAPIHDLAQQKWDAIVVGAGHNGLTCAAYLARAGQKVLVLEARDRVGGACTLEEPWPGYRVSPCAYVAGLLHPLVIDELKMRAHGFEWQHAEGGMFIPFEDGSSVQLWDDDARCIEELKRFAPGDVAGWQAMQDVVARATEAIRPPNERDMWIGRAPTRAQVEERLKGDEEAIDFVFNWSMVEYLEKYLKDERLRMAYLGQGVIGTNASPKDPGTASIYFYHYCGRQGDEVGQWGYVKGGMGMVSFILSDIAQELGVVIACETPVARILPGEGVELVGGDRFYAPIVVSNADPVVTKRLLGADVDADWAKQVEGIPILGNTVKVNLALNSLPNFKARPGTNEPHHRAVINTPLSVDDYDAAYQAARAGGLPERMWTEIYLQTVYDPSVAPQNKHTMSVFAQCVPYAFAEGTWDSRRGEVGAKVIESIARFCTGFEESVVNREVLGPPDIEKRVGLTGGHIFQGECLPETMWEKRLSPRTPMAGVFLCGACTHPGGGVVGVNGRNAAMEILGSL